MTAIIGALRENLGLLWVMQEKNDNEVLKKKNLIFNILKVYKLKYFFARFLLCEES